MRLVPLSAVLVLLAGLIEANDPRRSLACRENIRYILKTLDNATNMSSNIVYNSAFMLDAYGKGHCLLGIHNPTQVMTRDEAIDVCSTLDKSSSKRSVPLCLSDSYSEWPVSDVFQGSEVYVVDMILSVTSNTEVKLLCGSTNNDIAYKNVPEDCVLVHGNGACYTGETTISGSCNPSHQRNHSKEGDSCFHWDNNATTKTQYKNHGQDNLCSTEYNPDSLGGSLPWCFINGTSKDSWEYCYDNCRDAGLPDSLDSGLKRSNFTVDHGNRVQNGGQIGLVKNGSFWKIVELQYLTSASLNPLCSIEVCELDYKEIQENNMEWLEASQFQGKIPQLVMLPLNTPVTLECNDLTINKGNKQPLKCNSKTFSYKKKYCGDLVTPTNAPTISEQQTTTPKSPASSESGDVDGNLALKIVGGLVGLIVFLAIIVVTTLKVLGWLEPPQDLTLSRADHEAMMRKQKDGEPAGDPSGNSVSAAGV